MVLLELLYFNACSTVTKCNCNIEILKIWKYETFEIQFTADFLEGSFKKNIYIRNNTYTVVLQVFK